MPKVIAAILLLQRGVVGSSAPPSVAAVRVDRAPVVDGRLDDPEWSLAPAVTDFRQTDPDEGAPVSRATSSTPTDPPRRPRSGSRSRIPTFARARSRATRCCAGSIAGAPRRSALGCRGAPAP